MDLCPYETLCSPPSSTSPPLSPFCALFTASDWTLYNTQKSTEKYNSFGAGAGLGPTQGAGWVNELVARLTGMPVSDCTSTNHTLDSDERTFPLRRGLYADFTHDNVMTSILFALGLYAAKEADLRGFRASETVPFAGRAVVEKMRCRGEGEEMVRVVVNGKVMPLPRCGGDALGRCRLGAFVASLGFARRGGRWAECFKNR